ncbi:hypothetical protein FEM48_Zijuj01G0194400 [Ziziphus jujuba var. spinosa]|uniref:Gag1-like clamp domain-containing protein n=1 Tax=Ziziphus jujuba var. spinosa TaxID=714518 RepID=A0A978W346_ZIZJJ|nr:hypothetical protein FEM48_Zijuj01G0194400 [Ziziphus jujuba var. spinosa]
MVTLSASFTAWIDHFLACMGLISYYPFLCLGEMVDELHWDSSGCFGCCTKPTPIIAVDEPSKGLRIQGRTVNKPIISDGFWSSSTCDVDNSAFQSQRSISSTSASNQTFNHGSGVVNTSSSHPEFVNHGKFLSYVCLLLWNQTRLQWIENGRSGDQTQQNGARRLGWNTSYESLLGSKQPFPQRIPLTEMVEFLVEIWDHEGLYD